MYLEVYNYNVAFILCPLVSFIAWLIVCAVVEADRYHASTTPNLNHFII